MAQVTENTADDRHSPYTWVRGFIQEKVGSHSPKIGSHRPRQQARLPPIQGVRLWILVAILFVGLLLSILEQLIVGTALTNISSDLGGYALSSWVVTAYLMGYNVFLVVFGRASDIYGRRSAFLAALIIFTIASLACGVAQSMVQLIVFRGFQGIGGAGLFTLALNVATEIPGKARMTVQILVPTAFGIAAGAAPVIGGAIVSRSSWRWVFLLNVPPGVAMMAATFLAFPKNKIPLENNLTDLARTDWPGAALLTGIIIALGYALQEGSTGSLWKTARIIVPAVLQAIGWVIFFFWEYHLTKQGGEMLPIWPTRLFGGRVIGCGMLCAFLSGIPLYSIYIYLPQRLEIVGGLSALSAGEHFLVVPIVAFFATGWASGLCVKRNFSFPILLFAVAMQTLGLGLLSSVGITSGIPARLYGFCSLVGLGFGLSLPTLALVVRGEVGHLDHSVSMAALSSLRSLGGTVGVSIGRLIMTSGLSSSLSNGTLSPDQLSILSASPEVALESEPGEFTASELAVIRDAFDDRFNLINKVNAAFALAAFVVAIFCFRKKPVSMQEMDEKESMEKELLDQQANGLSIDSETRPTEAYPNPIHDGQTNDNPGV